MSTNSRNYAPPKTAFVHERRRSSKSKVAISETRKRFNMHKFSMVAAGAAALVGCTQAPAPQGMVADQKLQAVLAGKVAGPAVSCIPAYQTGNTPVLIAPDALAFRVNPGLVYVTNVQGTGCE